MKTLDIKPSAAPRRPRRWTPEEKVRIVEESFAGSRRTLATARRHGVPTSVLFKWRRAYREGRLAGAVPAPAFVEAVIVADAPAVRSAAGGRMEIVVRGGRVIVGPDVDAAALARVLAVLEGS